MKPLEITLDNFEKEKDTRKLTNMYYMLISLASLDSKTRDAIFGMLPFSFAIEKIYQADVPVYKVTTYPDKLSIISFDFVNENVIAKIVSRLNNMSREQYRSYNFQVPQNYTVEPIVLKDVEYDGAKLYISVYVLCDEATWRFFHKKEEQYEQ